MSGRRSSAIRGAWSSQVGDIHARRDGIRMVTEWGEGKAEAVHLPGGCVNLGPFELLGE